MFYFTFLKLLLQKHFTYVYVYFLVGNLCLFFSLGFRLVERNPGADDRCKRNQAEWPSAGGRFSICPQLYTGYVGGCQKVLRSPSVFGQFQSDSSSGFAKKKIQIQYRFFFFFYQKIFFSQAILYFFFLFKFWSTALPRILLKCTGAYKLQILWFWIKTSVCSARIWVPKTPLFDPDIQKQKLLDLQHF